MNIEAHPTNAEFTFIDEGISAFAHILALNAQAVKARLLLTEQTSDVLMPPARVHAILDVGSVLCLADCRMVHIDGDTAAFAFCTPIRQLHPRRYKRYSCQLPVQYRLLRENGVVSSWQEAVATDISMGGMRLSLHSKQEITSRLELRFVFTTEWLQKSWAKQGCSEGRAQVAALLEGSKPLHAEGMARYQTPLQAGTMQVGIQFVSLPQEDKLRLARILGESTTQRR